MAKKWIFTPARRKSIIKARAKMAQITRAGKRVLGYKD